MEENVVGGNRKESGGHDERNYREDQNIQIFRANVFVEYYFYNIYLP